MKNVFSLIYPAAVGLLLLLFFIPHQAQSNRSNSTIMDTSRTLIDERDGQEYPLLQIGGLLWMAQNLNYASPHSECYEGQDSLCQQYGRMYDYEESRKICPGHWRLPSPKDWKQLKKAVGSGSADRLVVPGVWEDEAFNGANNALGMNILPGGRIDEHGSYAGPGRYGERGLSSSFWLADEHLHWHIRWGKSQMHQHGQLAEQGRKFYVRCVCSVAD